MQSTTTQSLSSSINNGTYHEPYSSEERVALYMLNSAFNHGGRTLTPLQINKMVYLSHGWILGVFGIPLINNSNNQIQAWKYGPVVVGLYYMLKSFGNTSISVFDFLGKIVRSGRRYDVGLSSESEGDQTSVLKMSVLEKFREDYPEVAKGLNWVYDNYIEYSEGQLIALTCQAGSPWHEVYHDPSQGQPGLLEWLGLTASRSGSTPIPDMLIGSYYGRRVNRN